MKAQRREEEINTRKKLRDLGTRSASQFISQGHCEKIKATEEELQMEFSKLRKARMESELKEAEQTLDKRISPPCGGSPVEWRELAIEKTQIVVPTHTKMLDMFDPRGWTAMFPKPYRYGDGVFGVERRSEVPEGGGVLLGYRHRLIFREWCSYMLERDELEYEGGKDWGPDLVEVSENTRLAQGQTVELPSCRSNKDLMTIMYDLNRRHAYIQAARLYSRNTARSRALRELGQVRGQDMYDALEVVGKNAGFKELLGNNAVPEVVRNMIRELLICFGNVVGANASRTVQRHICNSYTNHFGFPLVFTTANVADTKQAMMSLMYEGATARSWRILEEHDPRLPSAREMLRRVAADPVSQAVFFNTIMLLFLRHVVGVDVTAGKWKCVDGVASVLFTGIFGVVVAFFAPIET